MAVTSVSKDQLESYIHTGSIEITEDPQYEEAEQLKKKGWVSSNKADQLFISCAEKYLIKAKEEHNPLVQALVLSTVSPLWPTRFW